MKQRIIKGYKPKLDANGNYEETEQKIETSSDSQQDLQF
eukprot:CAMPEP_0116883388 /NCGR_PEP_ID=MMETSP0463-20121206/15892_1 /TAXON_ID=181622 /ORGANISM="Strombidinopsis sp, Strain SopsisLIS2011" /LENGTH=38 /DNA_ID= /DNA_START= /DNA_END= /DNA_ORIENTATION=